MTALGLQLYTLRHADEGLSELLRAVAAAGYAGVETVGTQGVEPERLRAELEAAGLALASAHVALHDLCADPTAVAATYRSLGAPLVVVPWLAPADRPADAAGWTAFGRELDAMGARLADAGVALAYHHHDFELARGADGEFGLTHLMATADPAHLALELDTGWLTVVGEDPVAWLDAWGPRVQRLHLKDVDPSTSPPWADLGKGVLDGPGVVAAARRNGVAWCLFEHDAPAHPWGTVRHGAIAAARLLAAG